VQVSKYWAFPPDEAPVPSLLSDHIISKIALPCGMEKQLVIVLAQGCFHFDDCVFRSFNRPQSRASR
jgi:hypothetical protein